MNVDSEKIKHWLKPYIDKNTITLMSGRKFIMSDGIPYVRLYKYIEELEKE